MVFFIGVWWAALQKKSESLFPSIVWKAESWGYEMLSTRSVMVWKSLRFNKQFARQCVCGVFCMEFLAFYQSRLCKVQLSSVLFLISGNYGAFILYQYESCIF